MLARLVHGADGTRTVAAWSEALGAPLPRVLEAVRLGYDRRLLTHQLELPSAAPHPLVDLAERLAGLPGPAARAHLAGLEEVQRLMDAYGAADALGKIRLQGALRALLASRWSVSAPAAKEGAGAGKPDAPSAKPDAAGAGKADAGSAKPDAADAKPKAAESSPEAVAAPAPGSERQSHFYTDRLPMREECGADLRLTLGGARATELEQRLERPLELLGVAAEAIRQEARARVAQLLGRKRVPFWKVVAAFSDQPVPTAEAVSLALAAEVKDPTAREQVVEGPKHAAGAPSPLPLVCSVDLLVAAADVEAWGRGDYRVVMGDIHDTALVWGWALQFHPARAEVETAMVRALGSLPRDIPVLTALASRRTGLLPAELPGPVVELGGVSARASGWRLPFDDLVVESDGTTARLWSQGLQSEVCLYNGELESLVHTAFALPRIRPPRVETGAHTPRLVMDGVVLQREQWRLDDAQVDVLRFCKTDGARLRAAARLWADLGLPRHVFAKLPAERKPVLVNPASPLLLRVLVNLLDHRHGAVLSEMLPDPDGLWLRGAGGPVHLGLRCTFLRGGPG